MVAKIRPPIAGRYQILHPLSTSPESRVFVAEDLSRTGNHCALKICRMSGARALEAARREFNTLRKLRHPGIAEVYDFGQVERRELEAACVSLSSGENPRAEAARRDPSRRLDPAYKTWLASGSEAAAESFAFLVSVYYQGLSLRSAFTLLFPSAAESAPEQTSRTEETSRTVEEDRRNWRIFLLAVARICEALDVVHSRGLIHYDLKSENILLLPEPGASRLESFGVKILDFGLSEKATTPLGTRLRGTIPYMAPELLESSTADRRSDLFSLGVTLALAIGGRFPFPGTGPEEWLQAAKTGTRLPLDDLRPDLPDGLSALIDRLLDPDPKLRPQSASEVIRLLEDMGEVEWSPQVRRSAPPVPTVGWERELGMIQAEIDHMKRGEAKRALILLEGDSDQPLDRLADEVEALARAEGTRVETGHSRLPRRFAYQPFAEVVCRLLHGPPAPEQPGDRLLPVLSLFCPSVQSPQTPDTPGIQSKTTRLPALKLGLEVYRFLDLATEFFTEAAREQPLVLCLRDLHLAGKESLDLLHSLARNVHLRSRKAGSGDEGKQAEPVRLLIVGTFRRQETELEDDVEISGNLDNLSELVSESFTLHMQLNKLSLEEIPEWLRDRIPQLRIGGDTLRRLYEKSGGSIAFLDELVHWIPGTDPVPLEQGPARISGLRPHTPGSGDESARMLPRLSDVLLRIPRRAVDASLERIQHLPADDRHVLEILSVATGSLFLEEIEAVVTAGKNVARRASDKNPTSRARETDNSSLLSRMEKLEDLGLVTLREGVRDIQVRMSNPELARHIHMQMPEDARGPIHTRLALTLLDRSPADGPPRVPEDIAFHASQGGLRNIYFAQAMLAARKLTDALALNAAALMYETILDHLGTVPPDCGTSEIHSGQGPDQGWSQARIESLRLEINEKLAEMYGEQGHLQKAVEKLTLVSTARDTLVSPLNCASVYRKMGQIYQQSGEMANASYYLEKSLEILRPGLTGDDKSPLPAPGKTSSDEVTDRSRMGLLLTLLAIARLQLSRESVTQAEKSLKLCMEQATGSPEEAEPLCRAHLLQAEIQSRQNLHAESLEANLKALSIARYSDELPLLLDVLCGVGSSYLARGYHDEAVDCYEQALGVAGTLQSKFDMAVCHQGLGTICHNRADHEGALKHFTRSLDLCSRVGDLRGVARSYNNLGLVYRLKDDLTRAAECYRLAIDLFSRINDQVGMAAGMNNLATILELEGKYDEALEYSFRALDKRKKTRSRSGMAFCYYRIAKIHQSKGDLEKAFTFAERSLQLRQELGEKMGIAYSLLLLGELCLRQGKHQDAHRFCQQGLTDFESLENEVGVLMARACLARVCFALGRVREARQSLEEVLSVARESRQQLLVGECLLHLGRMAREMHNQAEAESRFIDAEKMFRFSQHRRELAEVLLARGSLHLDEEKSEDAEKPIEEAYSLLEDLGVRDLVPTYFLLRGRLEMEKPAGDLESARNFLERGLVEAKGVGLPELRARLYHQLGLLEVRGGDQQMGGACFERAHAFLEELHIALPEHLRSDFYRLGEREEIRIRAISLPDSKQPRPAVEPPQITPIGQRTPTRGNRMQELLAVNQQTLKLHDVASAMGSEPDLMKLLGTIMDAVLELVAAERGFLILKTGKRDAPPLTIARNLDREEISSPERKVSESISRKVLRTGKPVLARNAIGDQRFLSSESVRDLRLRSIACVPLRFRGRTLGIIYVDNRHLRNAFRSQDLNLLQVFADQAAVAVTNARLIEENRKHTLELEDANRKMETLNVKLKRKVLRRTTQLAIAREDLRERQSQLETRYGFQNIIGKSEALQEVFYLLDRVTTTDLPVLIEGESGTGKDLLARAIHFNSPHKSGRFVSESCGALTESLLETELFGHTKGAFTGAVAEKKGLFELADNGTLFLDDVDGMSLSVQQKLLRFLEEKEVRRVGAKESIRVQVRVLAASSRNLEVLSKEEKFRPDLYYRLNGIRIRLPGLRERLEDIPLLVEHFAQKSATKTGEEVRTFHPAAIRALMTHDWPGNVRELRHLVERTLLVAPAKVVQEEDIVFDTALADQRAALSPGGRLSSSLGPTDLGRLERTESLQEVRDESEREFVLWALAQSGGKVAAAARRCRISRESLYRLLRKHGIRPGR